MVRRPQFTNAESLMIVFDPLKFGSPAIKAEFGPKMAASTGQVVTEVKLSSPSAFGNPTATVRASPNLSSTPKSEAATLSSGSKGPFTLAPDGVERDSTPTGSSTGFGRSSDPAAFGKGTLFGGTSPFAYMGDHKIGSTPPPSTKRFKEG